MSLFFFFNDTATTEIYTLSLHDALPICLVNRNGPVFQEDAEARMKSEHDHKTDRKSTRLNSSHGYISYAVFCLKKKIIKDMRALPSICRATHSGILTASEDEYPCYEVFN